MTYFARYTQGVDVSVSSRRRRLLAAAGGSAALAGLALLSSKPARAAGPARLRPISDFLSRQGTACADEGTGTCYLYVPPAPNFLGWSTRYDNRATALFAGVDYAGLANAYFGNIFGTTMSGTVVEQPLTDGTAEVRVLLFTERANGWVIELKTSDPRAVQLADIASKPTLFGHRPQDAGGHALGRASLEIHFVNPAPGAPLPDLTELYNVDIQRLIFTRFNYAASGPLTAAFGVPEGTPGRCKIEQVGLVRQYFAFLEKEKAKSRVALDAFPAESISLSVVGR